MWLLCVQVALSLTGVYALISGKLPLSERMQLTGKRARITGSFLLLPILVPIGYGIVFTAIALSSGHPEDYTPNAGVLDIPVTFVAIALESAYVYMTRPKDIGTR